ncbi:hypothetical protein ASE95_10465 [Sphingomonas sp. Leaf231]|uniref:hypothetical protein n=1 Tax=Sphingomonas sp. Leaf231 TaxID=1736301 RepID=UPI0006F7AC2A|nr:hypothetical protein [Sphingomonas sp. Leaf231]KQN93006.1 hypothetical protein ASE95_10465 [Sphingomonas sp. Leaf231]
MEESTLAPTVTSVSDHKSRRLLLASLVGSVLAAGASKPASAQIAAGVDIDPLQVLTNMFYTSVNYSQTGFYADEKGGRQLGVELIRSGELTGQPVTRATGARPTPIDTESVRARVNEIIDECFWRLVVSRRFLRAEAPGQKAVDLSPQAFTAMFRAAGAIEADQTFDPYENEGNFVLGLFALTDFYPMAVHGMAPLITNEIARAWLGGFAAGVGNNTANLRALIVDMSVDRPELIEMADQIALWHDQVAGLRGPDRRIWPGGAQTGDVANLCPLDADGLVGTMTPQQVFNILFMSSTATTKGGFFPDGVNGNIKTSAAR